MSATTEEEEVMLCASCGVAGSDDIKLKRCNACYLVRYCGVKCQKDHRPKHKKECKKRVAELEDEMLFKQPEGTHLGDCPICCLPMPIEIKSKSVLASCCSKRICNGCNVANQKREKWGRLEQKCAFCRKPLVSTDEEFNERKMKRIEANDPVAMYSMGTERYDKGDYKRAFEYYSKAAALGDVEAHYQLSALYHKGEGVEKDRKRELHHLKQAAIEGHPDARHNLGCFEGDNGRADRAAKHFIIAAKLGFEPSLDTLKKAYKAGLVSKDDFTEALRGYQIAIEAMKSPQREEAEKVLEWLAEQKRKEMR